MKAENIDIASRISDKLLRTLDLNELLESGVTEIVQELDLLGGILLLQRENKLYTHSISKSPAAESFKNVINMPLKMLEIALEKRDNLIVDTFLNKRINQSYELYDFTRGALNQAMTTVAQYVTNTVSAASIPLVHQNQSIGVLYLAKSEKDDFSDQLAVITLIANYLAIAIVNAKLYLELKMDKRQLEYALREISEIRQAEIERIRMFVHDIKNPVTSLFGSLEIINTDDKKVVDIMHASTQQIMNILDRLRSYLVERDEEDLTITEVDVKRLGQQIHLLYQPLAEQKGLKFKFKCAHRSLTLLTDEMKLSEIITNLITNAIKYTNTGEVSLIIRQFEEGALIKVSDTGVGIDEADLGRIGTKFFRAYRTLANLDAGGDSSGTGLGTYIVKTYAQMLGGRMEISSEAGKGSTFEVYIPSQQMPYSQTP